MWTFDTPIGQICIKQVLDGRYGFFLNEDLKEVEKTAWGEADNISAHSTGCPEWDECCFNVPSDLSEWNHITR